MPDIDKIVADYAPYVTELAKTVSLAQGYYQREEFKNDAFAKGKEYHKTLTEGFAKLDEQQARLGDAVTAWHKDHAPDATKLEAGQKPGSAAVEAARALVLVTVAKKFDSAAFKAGIDKVDAAATELKAFGDKDSKDPYPSALNGPVASFLKAAKDAKTSDKGMESDAFLTFSQAFTSVLDANQSALSRSLVAKGQALQAPMPIIAPVVAPSTLPQAAPTGSAAPAAPSASAAP
jgi:hypothetical protein